MSVLEPKKMISSMLNSFENISGDLVHISYRNYWTNEQENALYGYIYAKPSHRLAKLLSVTREVLVLATSFNEQQIRTIQNANKIIEESSGRLEPTVMIVLHKDPGGNAKLKSWGRNYGSTVLPIFVTENTFPTTSAEFETVLCQEMFSHDPFDVTGPVQDDSQFYGRKLEALSLARQLQSGQIKTTIGIRKIGKTSYINRVMDVCKNNHECIVIFIDCSREEVYGLNSDQLIFSIYCSLKAAREENRGYVRLDAQAVDLPITRAGPELIAELEKVDVPVIIVFDEIDYITPGSPTAVQWQIEFNQFWRNLRVIYQECSRIRKPLSLLISCVSSKWFKVESIDGVENSALAFVPEDYLGPFPRGASLAMIRTLFRIAGLRSSDEVCDMIADACADAPYWIRKAGSYIHKNVAISSRPLDLNATIVNGLLDSFLTAEGGLISEAALRHLMRVYPELMNSCANCYRKNFSLISPSEINVLCNYGIVRNTASGLEISGNMIHEGLTRIFENTEPVNQISNKESEIPNNEWVEELVLISRRRNLLEAQLRQLVLNFMMMDSLQHKERIKPKARVIKCFNDNRKEQLSAFDVNTIMEKLNWAELTTIITKEWSLFDKLFTDKSAVNDYSSVINDRPDAHAKKVDQYDIYAMRKALDFFEDRLKKAEG